MNENISFKEILTQYNDSVSAVRDLENALSTLVGKAEWEDSIMSDKRRSIQVLYTELKAQRNIREKLEESVYALDNGTKDEGTQTVKQVDTSVGTSSTGATETEKGDKKDSSTHTEGEKESKPTVDSGEGTQTVTK